MVFDIEKPAPTKGYTKDDVSGLLVKRDKMSSKRYYLKEALRELGIARSIKELRLHWFDTEISIDLPRNRDAIRDCLVNELYYAEAAIKKIDDYCSSLPQMPGVE